MLQLLFHISLEGRPAGNNGAGLQGFPARARPDLGGCLQIGRDGFTDAGNSRQLCRAGGEDRA